MKTINIYLTRQQKQQVDKVRSKYKVSMSTLVGKIAYWTYYVLKQNNNDDLTEQILTEYIQKNGTYKTSIKPREIMETLGNEIKTKNIYASNSLVIWLNKDIKKYITNQKLINKYYNEIDKALNETFDTYWDYNNGIRNQRRMFRQNKEYWKKALEDAS